MTYAISLDKNEHVSGTSLAPARHRLQSIRRAQLHSSSTSASRPDTAYRDVPDRDHIHASAHPNVSSADVDARYAGLPEPNQNIPRDNAHLDVRLWTGTGYTGLDSPVKRLDGGADPADGRQGRVSRTTAMGATCDNEWAMCQYNPHYQLTCCSDWESDLRQDTLCDLDRPITARQDLGDRRRAIGTPPRRGQGQRGPTLPPRRIKVPPLGVCEAVR